MLAGPCAAERMIAPSSSAASTPHTMRRRSITGCLESKKGADCAPGNTVIPDPQGPGGSGCSTQSPGAVATRRGRNIKPVGQPDPSVRRIAEVAVTIRVPYPSPRRLEHDQGGRPDFVSDAYATVAGQCWTGFSPDESTLHQLRRYALPSGALSDPDR